MGIQTMLSPSGEELVVMSRADYETLIAERDEAFEDGADAAACSMARETAEPEDLLPPDVSKAILSGRGRLRAYREWRGLSAEALASASAVPQARIEAIEAGAGAWDHDEMARLAQALDVPLRWMRG